MLKILAFSLSCLLITPVHAQSVGAQLNKCLENSTTGRDRKDLALWFVTAAGSHPDIRNSTNPVPGLGEKTSRAVGELVTRLFTVDCAQEAKAAFRSEGGAALDRSFEMLGQLAMMEILQSADVRAAMGNFGKYIDQERMKSLFVEK